MKEKHTAQAEYNTAVSSGQTAVKLEQKDSTSIFEVALGNIAAGEKCMVSFTYVLLSNRHADLHD